MALAGGGGGRSLRLCWQCMRNAVGHRALSTSPLSQAPEQTTTEAPSSKLDPYLVSWPREERKLLKETGKNPIGSRRRRAALKSSANIPFEQLPFQCFQEARKFLHEDRQEKLELIQVQRSRMERLADTVTVDPDATLKKETRLRSMRLHLDYLKIQADINDPVVKKRFEDGLGDLNTPIIEVLTCHPFSQHDTDTLMAAGFACKELRNCSALRSLRRDCIDFTSAETIILASSKLAQRFQRDRLCRQDK